MDNVAINPGCRFNLDRWESRLSKIREAAADRIQCFYKMGDRALTHSSDAVQYVFAATERQRGRQRTHSGTGIPEKKISLLHREVAAAAFHFHFCAVVGNFEFDTERLQCADHHFRIFGDQQII